MRAVSLASMIAISTLSAGSAGAMPTPAPYSPDSAITLAAGGCGYAFHRNVYGACVPNGYGGLVVAPGFYGAPGYGGWHGGGYYHGGGWHGAGWHGGGWHGGGYHGGGWHGGGAHWHGGGGHYHGGGAHFHGGGHHR